MLDIKLGTKQINNLHILFENINKYDKRFNGYKLLPITYKRDSYEDFERSIVEFINTQILDSDEYSNALSYFGIYPDEYDKNVVIANQIIDIYGDELKDRPIVEVACGNFPALSTKIIEKYPEVKNIRVYDFDLVVDKKLDSNDVEGLDAIEIIKKDFDSSKEIPKNSLIVSRHPCISLPGIIASRTINKDNNSDLYTVLCHCDNEYMNLDIYDFDDSLIRPSVTSLYRYKSLDWDFATTLFNNKLKDKNGNPISWQDHLEEYFENDPDYHFTSTIDPTSGSIYKVMYTKKR